MQKVKSQLSNIVEITEKGPVLTDIGYTDIQDLQVVQDRSLKLYHFLKINRTVLLQMQNYMTHITRYTDTSTQVRGNFISSLVTDADMQLRRAYTVIKRLDGTLDLVCDEAHHMTSANNIYPR